MRSSRFANREALQPLALACVIAALDAVFIAALAPLLPTYVDMLGIDSLQAGLLAASYSVGLLIAALPAGLAVTRVGVRTAMLASLALLGVACITFGISTDYLVLVGARAAEGAASAVAWTAMLVWLTSVIRPERRGEALGIVFAAAFAGFTLGPVLGAVAVAAGPRAVFTALGLVSIAACIPGALLVSSRNETGSPFSEGLASYWPVVRQRGTPSALWLLALPGFVFGCLSVIVSLRLAELGLSAREIGLTFFAAGLLQVIASPVTGRWSDRSGPTAPIRAGLIGSAVLAFVMALPLGVVGLACAFPVCWLLVSLLLVPGTELLSGVVERAGMHVIFAFSLMNLVYAPGAIAGALLAGATRDSIGDQGTLVFVATITLATLSLPVMRGTQSVRGSIA